jgi:hypothetical protein
MQYVFSSLESLADYCANQSRKEYTKLTKKQEQFAKGEAYAWLSIANMLRNTIIREK